MSRTILLFFIFLSLNLVGLGQSFLKDKRDGQIYKTFEINGTVWMLDNLNYKSTLSKSLGAESKNDTIARGRYYHVYELDSVCPDGWRLPDSDEWIQYLHLVEEGESELQFEIKDELRSDDRFLIVNFEDVYNPFEENNPLNIKNTGWIQGGEYSSDVTHLLATYWTADIKDHKLNRTHIHITPMWINIHTHRHHIKPKDEKTLRLFMVRCVR